MSLKITKMFRSLIEVEPEERVKLFFLTLTFFLIIGAYTLVKDLKDGVFVSLVGREYVPLAQTLAMFILIPAILFYSKLVDQVRRYQLLCIYSIIFGIAGFVFAYLLGHPTIGMANTHASPYRIFGWLFYFFGEGFSPFIVGVFWAYANSVNSPEAAKKNYGLLAAGSKLGGVLSAGFAWALLSFTTSSGHLAYSDAFNHQVLLALSSFLVLLVPISIIYLMKNVPGQYLHGYEAAYKVEKERSKAGTSKTGMFAGLEMLVKQPYVMGMFGMVFFYEVVAKVLSYLRLGVAQENASSFSAVSAFLFKITFFMHITGFLLSFLGTRTLLNLLGERICLLIIPISTGLLLAYFVLAYSPDALIIAVAGNKVINYAFAWPVRESLYIPTTKEIKFKSKSWIDAFGSKFAKTSGSVFNWLSQSFVAGSFVPALAVFFVGVVGLWSGTAFLLGNRFDEAVANNEVIGLDKEDMV